MMSRIAALLAAAALVASPAFAASYSAKPAAMPAAKTIIGKDVGWNCAGGSCSGKSETGRPLLICQDLAKRAGRLESFSTDGRALGDDQLAKCNSAAKEVAAAALARAN
jgi:hypothetical protein